MGRTVVAGALLLGAGAVISPARAQASGTLQASTTVVDDPVSRSVSAGIARLRPDHLEKRDSPLPVSIRLADHSSARATIHEIPSDAGQRAGGRRIRIDVVHLR
jgi:hypothetical protein